MHSFRRLLLPVLALAMAALMTTNCGIIKKKYENPIAKDTLQPDKVLFDRAVNDIEHGRYEVARLTLNTLINTYDSSEYMAKAKLAIADSWYREGGAHGLAQAEAEYKDFELFYPTMEESAEAQWRVCQIHYKQMDKVDRDNSEALRAEEECRQMLVAYPNSHYTAQATQMLRNVQEVLAAKEFGAGEFYHSRGAFPAAENRYSFVSQQYPLFSHADDALWEQADSFRRMGDRFEDREAAALAKIVKQYPLSDHVDDAKQRLTELKKPIPAADPVAYERMKYDMEAMKKPSMLKRSLNLMERSPETYMAAKTGTPAMEGLKPPTPVSVPAVAPTGEPGTPGGNVTGTTDVTAGTVKDTSALESQPNQLGGGAPKEGAAGSTPATPAAAKAPENGPPQINMANLPNNHVESEKDHKKRMKAFEQQQKLQQKKLQKLQKKAPPAQAAPASTTTPAATPAAPASTPAPTTPQQ